MNLKKKILTMAMCAVISTSSAVGMVAQAIGETENAMAVFESQMSYDIIDTCSNINSKCAVKQPGVYGCWAACIMSVIMYNNSSARPTFQNIYDQANFLLPNRNLSVGDGIVPNDMDIVVSNYFFMNTKKQALTDNQIIDSINHARTNKPIIGVYTSNGNYHAVVIYGYKGVYYSNYGLKVVTDLYVMNPTDGTFETIPYNSDVWERMYYYSN